MHIIYNTAIIIYNIISLYCRINLLTINNINVPPKYTTKSINEISIKLPIDPIPSELTKSLSHFY